MLDSWRYLIENGRIELYGYVIMENHLHLIASSKNLSKEIGDFKSFTARKIIDMLQSRNAVSLLDQMKWHRAAYRPDREFQLWQEGSHPQQIQSDEMMRQKLEYIHLNPVRRGYVDDAAHWRYSSARDYARTEGLVTVITQWG